MDNIVLISGAALIIIMFVNGVIGAIGCAFLFKKKGIKPLYAFIPFVHDYQISIVAEREEDGRTYCILNGFYYMFSAFITTLEEKSPLYYLVLIIQLTLYLSLIVFSIRIYLGLCKEFGRSKKWIILFSLYRELVLLYWGLNRKFVPARTINLDDGVATSNATVGKIDNGLTINLEERSATKFFRKKILLKDIHLSIPTGHMVLLLGGSGAGKTTFVNAATGYEKADAEVTLSGHNIYDEYEQMKYDLGFAPQQDLMRTTDTVIMTLKDAATLRLPKNISWEEKDERVDKVMELFGLSAVQNNLVSSLSGGQRKRLSIAMEFISDPTLFFLDEPDSGLDGVMARRLFTQLRAIADEGKIVVVITHTPDRVIDLFDDVIVLAKDSTKTGRLAYFGPVSDAYDFFGKKSMEEILLSINPKDEGGEAKSDEFIEKYATYLNGKVGQMA